MDLSKRPVFINVTASSIVKILLILVLFYLLFLIKSVLAMLFVALILASAIDPWVDWLQARKIPRGVSVIFIYLIALSVFFGVVTLIVPPVADQISELSDKYPEINEYISAELGVVKDAFHQEGIFSAMKSVLDKIREQNSEAVNTLITYLFKFIDSVFSFFLVSVITFYMVVEEKAMKKVVWSIAPPKYQMYIMGLINRMQLKIGLWLRGQIILSLIIFTLTYIALSILGVQYALVLAMIAGLTEFVPYLGPILASIPAIFLAFTQSPLLAVFVAILYYIVQITENNIIVPKLMQKVVGINPIISITVLLIGFKLAWIPGAILSIPVATALSVFLGDIFENKIVSEENETA